MSFSAIQTLTGLPGRLDAHAHVFNTHLPMSENRRYTPQSSASVGAYLGLLKQHGLDGGVLVQPSFLGTDNSFLLASLDRLKLEAGMSFAGVATLTPGTTERELTALNNAGIKGMRLNLFGTNQPISFDIKPWANLLKRMDARDWHVEVHCEGKLLANVLPKLLRHCGKIVVDHFGLPGSQSLPGQDCPGQDAIFKAPGERVFVKTSAPYRVFPDQPVDIAVKLCKPTFTRLRDELGPDRLLWGSDWPWTQFENNHCYADTLHWWDSWQSD